MNSLVAVLIALIWLPFMLGDEQPEDMEKKAAVDCKTIKKTNTRTMNFTEKGKEYVCKQLVEKEHKVFTFFKVPENEEEEEEEAVGSITNQPKKKGPSLIKYGGKIYYLLGKDGKVSSVKRKKVQSNNTSATDKLGVFASSENSANVTEKYQSLDSQLINAVRRKFANNNSTDKNTFKLPFSSWLKLPISSEDIVPESQAFESFEEVAPHSNSIIIDRPVLFKLNHNKNKTKLPKALNLDITPKNQSYPLKFIEEIPQRIETNKDVTLNPTSAPIISADGQYSKSIIENHNLESLEDSLPDLLVENSENDIRFVTQPFYNESLAKIISNTETNQLRESNL